MRRVWDGNYAGVGVLGLLVMLCGGMSRAEDLQPPDPGGAVPDPGGNAPIRPSDGWMQRWLNPKSAPFIPVPEIATDPDSGLTLGLLAVYLKTDENNAISQIIAPDFLHNPNFGFGTHARIYSFASNDKQWSLVAGIKERVEREFDAEYQIGRARLDRWSMSFSAIYDRDGTPRFYGIGNRTRESGETSFTNNQELMQANVGYNISHEWQILYTARLQVVDVQSGTIDGIPSIQNTYPTLNGLNTHKMLRNRLSIIYDTRDDLTVPTTGLQLITYAGVASSNGLFNNSIYSETGLDVRGYWPIFSKTILAAHSALRYLPAFNDVPFWALSSVGGGQSDVGGQQTLRGFGSGRFYGRNSFATTVELRQTVMHFNAAGSSVDLEVAPFVDVARVFGRTDTFPLGSLHPVYGVGFRGIAKPFVVGHVDLGYGSEGLAVFTGLNYPF